MFQFPVGTTRAKVHGQFIPGTNTSLRHVDIHSTSRTSPIAPTHPQKDTPTHTSSNQFLFLDLPVASGRKRTVSTRRNTRHLTLTHTERTQYRIPVADREESRKWHKEDMKEIAEIEEAGRAPEIEDGGSRFGRRLPKRHQAPPVDTLSLVINMRSTRVAPGSKKREESQSSASRCHGNGSSAQLQSSPFSSSPFCFPNPLFF